VMAERPPHDVLSDCLERWEQGQGGVDEFLAQHPELRAELEPLLGLAVELWALPKITAPDHLRQDPLWRRPPARVPLGSRHPRAKAPLLPFPLVGGQKPRAEDVLDEALAREKLGGRLAADAVLARHPSLRPEVTPLLDLADDLAALREVRAPARLRQDPLWRRATPTVPQWAAARQDSPAVSPPRSFPRLPHRTIVVHLSRLAAGVGGAALAALMAGTVVTSATSLPDQPLYPVKRLVEDAQLVITPPESRVDAHLRRAQERMKETQEMIERDRAEAVPALVDAYVREVDAVRTELQSPRARVPEPEKVEKVLTRLEANEQALGAMAERVAEPARPAVARAAEASRPENVAPAESPRSVTAPESSSRSVAPVAAPTFGAGGPASVQEPGRSTIRQLIEATSTPAPSATPAQVRAPAVSPALLPSAGGPNAGGSPTTGSSTTTGTNSGQSAASSTTTGAPALSPSATPTKPAVAGAPPSPTAVFQILPPAAPSSGSPPAVSPAAQPAAGSPGTLPAPSTSSATQPTPLSSPAGRTAEPTDRAAPDRNSAAPSLVPAAEPGDRGTPDRSGSAPMLAPSAGSPRATP
jgi:Domain of unknown function (DUF5667)